MNNPLGLRILTTTLAGVMTISMVACTKTVDSTTSTTTDTTTTTTPTGTTTTADTTSTTSGTGAAAPSISMGTELDDSVVTTRVKAALLDHIDIKGFDIQVETRKGEVMLSGFVANQSQVDQAMKVTKAVEGVTSVIDKLALKEGAATTIGTKLDDSVITARVKSALLADASIKGLDITVTTRKGETQLSGFVDNRGQIDRAVEVARGIEGVTQVGNEMSVKK